MFHKLISIVFLFYISQIYFINSCGITTHTEIAHRAASHYEYLLNNKTSIKELIKKYQSAFQAGNPYPDSFYPGICKKGTLHDVSEDTHWTPFLNATIKYIQRKYSKPYNEVSFNSLFRKFYSKFLSKKYQIKIKDALRLIIFTLGYSSHQIADITWHSLGIEQGFLSAMGFVNFHGSFSDAHSVGDFGGDVVNQFELNTNYISDLGDWYVPHDDLYNIYLDLYGTELITRNEIIECSSLLFLGRLGEQIAVSLLYANFFNKSSFLADKLNDYFLGGLDDMATWTQLTWNKIFFMLENGVEKCQLDHNPLYINCANKDKIKNNKFNKITKSIPTHSNIEKYGLDRSYIDQEITSKGLIIKSNKKFEQYLNKLNLNYNHIESISSDLVLISNSTYYTKNDYSQLGTSLASGDLNNDGLDDLIIGAPVYSEENLYQNGAVFVLMSNNMTGSIPFKNLNLETESSLIIKPPNDAISSRFGHSITILDINQDGFNDIIISAPSYNLENLEYQGRVYVYFGDKSFKYDSPPMIIACNNIKYCNMGWFVTKGDLNGDKFDDLIISSPYATTWKTQCGFVMVIFSSSSLNRKYEHILNIEDSDWFVYGQMDYEWFGYSVKVKLGYLIIGAPESRICQEPNCDISEKDLQAVGRVYVYKYPSKNPILILTGQSEFEQFGYDLDISYQLGSLVLAVSSVTKMSKIENRTSFELNRAGIVRLFNIDSSNFNYNLISSIKSDRPYSSFGSKIKFLKIGQNEDLFISSQMRSESSILIDKIQEGSVYMFEGGKNLFSNFTDECPLFDLSPCPNKHAKRIFTTSEKRSRFGFDLEFLKAKNNQTNIAISAIHADNQQSRLSGQVKLFNL